MMSNAEYAWQQKNLSTRWYQQLIPQQLRVMHSGCQDEGSPEPFDYIICSPWSLAKNADVQILFSNLARYCNSPTRIIAIYESPLLPRKHYFSTATMELFFKLAGFEVIRNGRYDSRHSFMVARVTPNKKEQIPAPSVSVIIPCRNERGTIEDAVKRCPAMGSHTELIFVDGHSTDGTIDELYRVQMNYPERNIRILQQTGKGKGDAVRLGFSHAQGDICMLLDSDLAVPPEELPKFYQALLSGVGEFINGSRLIYPMEDKATPWLNYFVNHAFALVVSWIIGQRVTDTLCGTKVFWRKDYQHIIETRSLLNNMDPFGDFDLLFGAARLSKKIVDIPVHCKNRVYGSPQIGSYFRNGILLLRVCYAALRQFKIY